MNLMGELCDLNPLSNTYALKFADFLGGLNFQHTFTGSIPMREVDVAAEWDRERAAKSLQWGIFSPYPVTEVRWRDGGRFIGTTGLYSHRDIYRSFEFRILIGHPDCLGKGIGTEVTRMVVDWGFKRLNAHRIWLGVNAENLGAIKCYEKVGFKREGVLRDEIFCNGHYTDAIRMGLLESDWKEEVHVEA